MSASRIQKAVDYGIFVRSDHNRATNIKSRKKLEQSMRKYGFLRCFPIVVRRDGTKLVVKDGQHRLAMAKHLQIPVYWVEEDTDFDIALINTSPEKWKLTDYANMFAKLGYDQYIELLEFSGQHKLPLGLSACLLAGTTTFGNVSRQFMDGEYKIRDREWANSVAAIYGPLVSLCRDINNKSFIGACMAVTRVPGFEISRMIRNAAKCREKLVSYSTKEAYIEMLEQIYNFGRVKLVPLKFEAQKVMRARNVAYSAKAKT